MAFVTSDICKISKAESVYKYGGFSMVRVFLVAGSTRYVRNVIYLKQIDYLLKELRNLVVSHFTSCGSWIYFLFTSRYFHYAFWYPNIFR